MPMPLRGVGMATRVAIRLMVALVSAVEGGPIPFGFCILMPVVMRPHAGSRRAGSEQAKSQKGYEYCSHAFDHNTS